MHTKTASVTTYQRDSAITTFFPLFPSQLYQSL